MKKFRLSLWVDLRRSILSLPFLLTVLMILLWLWLNGQEYTASEDAMRYLPVPAMLSHSSSGIGNFTPLLLTIAAIPYSWSYCVDKSSGFLEQAAARISLPVYAMSKVLAVAFSSFLACLIGMGLYTVFLEAQGMPDALESYAMEGTGPYLGLVDGANYLVYFLVRVTVTGLACSLAAVFGLMVTAYIPNLYMAFIPSQLLYYLLDIVYLSSRLSAILYELYLPSVIFEQMFPHQPWKSFLWAVVLLGGLSVLCSWLFYRKLCRKQVGV